MGLQTDAKMPDGVLGALNMLSRSNARYANFLQELLAACGDRYFPSDLDELERKAAVQVKKLTGRTINLKASGYVPHPTITPDIAVHFIRLMAGGCSAEQAARQQGLSVQDAEQMEVDYQDPITISRRKTPGISRDEYLHSLLTQWRSR